MKTHARFRTPYISIVICAVIMLALSISGSFITALTISTITRLLAYAATCAAMIVLRRKAGAPPASFSIRGGVVVAGAALILIAWLLVKSEVSEMRAVAIAIAVGLALHFAYRFMRPKAEVRGFAVITKEEVP